MRKTQGWEIRLSNYIHQIKDEPFKRGVHDCALFAGVCVDIMTGLDTTSVFRQPYKTKKQAYEFLKKMGYDGLASIPDKLLNSPYPSPAFAQRGDVVLIDFEGEEALGIVDMSGKRAVTVGADGLVYYDMKHWVKAWDV